MLLPGIASSSHLTGRRRCRHLRQSIYTTRQVRACCLRRRARVCKYHAQCTHARRRVSRFSFRASYMRLALCVQRERARARRRRSRRANSLAVGLSAFNQFYVARRTERTLPKHARDPLLPHNTQHASFPDTHSRSFPRNSRASRISRGRKLRTRLVCAIYRDVNVIAENK